MVAYPLKENATSGVAAQHGNFYDTKKTAIDIRMNQEGRNLVTGGAQLLKPNE